MNSTLISCFSYNNNNNAINIIVGLFVSNCDLNYIYNSTLMWYICTTAAATTTEQSFIRSAKTKKKRK